MKDFKMPKKILSVLLAVSMMLSCVPVPAYAVTTDNLCDHHTAHTAECGYAEAVAGVACGHEHSEDCYAIVQCIHEHDESCGTDGVDCVHECTVDNGCITMELDCHHTHGDCGYSEGTAEVPCGHVHNESCGYAEAVAGTPCANAETDPECDHAGDCGYVAAVEGQPCGHTEHLDCGYAPATEGTPCTHTHAVKVDGADSCYKLLCSHKDGSHDDACGYVAAVEAHECHYECAECAAAQTADETTEPAPVCDCGTDDESVHATTCGVYVAPETAVCCCTEKCSDTNVWCDVCGFDYTRCGGTDTAVPYADTCTCTTKCAEGSPNADCAVCVADLTACTGTESATTGTITGYASDSDGDACASTTDCTGTYAKGICSVCGGYQPAVLNEDGVYEISNAGQLYWFAAAVNGGNTAINGKLMEDITVNTGVLNSDGTLNGDGSTFRAWTPIGAFTYKYTGTFDGNNKTVSGLYFNDSATINVGLFGYVDRDGKVQNVGVVDSYLNGDEYVGGVIGNLDYGTVQNCYNTGTVSGSSHVGGVLGFNCDGTVTNCYNTGAVSGGYRQVGGVVGNMYKGTVQSCYNTGTVSGSSLVGGVVGYHYDGTITNCYYLSGTAAGGIDSSDVTGSAEAKTAAQFASGEVAYLLNGDQSTIVFKQTLGTDDYPNFTGAQVYYGYNSCAETATEIYTNDSTVTAEKPAHSGGTATCSTPAKCEKCGSEYGEVDTTNHDRSVAFNDNGFCPNCGEYEPATLIEDTESAYNGYYEIGNAGQLFWFAEQINSGAITNTSNAVLTADIDLENRAWTPIGRHSDKDSSINLHYSGTFDGQNHVIKNLSVLVTTTCEAGLFSRVESGTLQNFGIINATVENTQSVRAGVVAGEIHKSTVTNVFTAGDITVTTAHDQKGGIAGECASSTLTGCYTTYSCLTANKTAPTSVTNCYYLAESENTGSCGEFKTAEQFASGEVAYLLQGEQETHVWGQTLGTENADAYPTLGGAKVYSGYASCANEAAVVYTNTESIGKPHTYENGICTAVEGEIHYQPAELVDGIYKIGNAGQLVWFAEQINSGAIAKNANAILTDNIDMDGIAWTTICSTGLYYENTYASSYDGVDTGYAGTFNGDGHVIKNLSVTAVSGAVGTYGLFGTMTGTVKNLGIEGFTYNHNSAEDMRVGAIVGQNLGGTIENCYVVKATITPGTNVAGGITGCNYAGTIKNCYVADSTVLASASRYGYIAGDNRADTEGDRTGTIDNCYTDGDRLVGSYTGTETGCGIRSERRFASGEVAYLLGSAWGQGETLPVLRGGATVYENLCGGDIFYSTTDGDFESHDIGSDYLCTNCKSYEPATLVTAENYSSLGLDESYVGYYAIENASNLYWYSERERIGEISGSIVLLSDITIDNSVAEWVPIVWDGDCTFDGRGNTITLNLDYGTTQRSENYGLFGTCNYSVVKNLVLDGDLTVNTTGHVGAVAGSMYRTTVSGVISTANVTNTCTTSGSVGGLAGCFGGQHDTARNQYSKIENSAVYANVTGYNAGGLVGEGWGGYQYWDITNAAYVGNVTTNNTTSGTAGAIVGYQNTDYNTSTFTNIYWCEENGLDFYGKRDTENQVYTNTSAKTADQFASGEVAYLLSGGVTDGTQVWYQTCGQGLPAFGGETVYQVTNCKDDTLYSNTNENIGHIYAGSSICTVCGTECAHSYDTNGFCTLCGSYQPAVDSDGDGYYEIGNAGQLYWFAAVVNDGYGDVAQNNAINAVLTENITVNQNLLSSLTYDENGAVTNGDSFRVWTPIGNKYSNKYTGTFDGNNKTVSGLYFNNSATEYVGLFGRVGSGGKVQNVGVVDSYLNGGDYVGGVAGGNDGTVESCYNTGTVSGGSSRSWVGGVVGYSNGTITNCYNTGTVSGGDYSRVGGVAGANSSGGTVRNCYNTGSVSGNYYVGGVVGFNDTDGGSSTIETVESCYNSGTVTAGGEYSYVGGVVGTNDKMINCYNTGTVTGTGYCVGGLAGYNSYGGTAENCYNTGSVSGGGSVGGVVGQNYSYGGSSATVKNCYYLSGTATGGINGSDVTGSAEVKTADQFAYGEVAYLLQAGQTAGEDGVIPQVWGQDLDNGKTVQTIPTFTGAKVYQLTCTPCPVYAYSNSEDAVITAQHDFTDNNGTCVNCGFVEVKLMGYTVSLSGNIGLNFYFLLDESIQNEQLAVKFTIPGEEVTYSNLSLSDAVPVTINGNACHVFSAGVAAKDMTQDIQVEITTSTGNTYTFAYSVYDYAQYILNNSASYSEKTVELVDAMLHYGAYAQIHFNYHTDQLPVENPTVTAVTAETINTQYANEFAEVSGALSTTNASFLGAKLLTRSLTSIHLYFKVNVDSDVKFLYNGNEVQPISTEETSYYNCYVAIPGISAKNLDMNYTITVVDGEETITVTYNPMKYCSIVLADTTGAYTDDLKNVVTALYWYNQAANTYFADEE